MFVVLLQYTKPLEEIDLYLAEHSEWISRQYELGNFLASGRREPRTGGVIITRAMTRGHLDALLATDPFARHDMVRHEVIEFHALNTIPELVKYADHLEPAQAQTAPTS